VRFKALKTLDFDFDRLRTKTELRTLCRRATPKEWGKYSQASFSIKCLIKVQTRQSCPPKAKTESDNILHKKAA